MNRVRILLPIALLAGTPALAQSMSGWGHDSWGHDSWGRESWRGDSRGERTHAQPSKKIDVETFRATDAASLLGKGRIVVSAAQGAEAEWKLPVYEAAVIDELARHGYDTANAADPAQVVQVAVSHDTVVPEEAPHKPVSGAMSTTISNRGTGFGMALAIDLTKPAKAIVSTRLDVRIRDKATNRVLWEGHAQGQSREDDAGLDNGAVAARLAAALFAKFPEGQSVTPLESGPLDGPPPAPPADE
ncbi:MAG: hypothetical protein RIS94_2843 [Pseudomonadota bacterium]|jgi:hypothetical protein